MESTSFWPSVAEAKEDRPSNDGQECGFRVTSGGTFRVSLLKIAKEAKAEKRLKLIGKIVQVCGISRAAPL
jgi:hypothetical protein